MKEHHAHKLHGILFMALFSFAAVAIADLPVFSKTLHLSPLIIGIILGMMYANTLRQHLPSEWVPGIKYCSKQILRISIIFFGFRLTLANIVKLGWATVGIDAIIVVSVILLGLLIGKLLKIDRDTTILCASGSAICGAAAVLGTEPVLKNDGNKTVIAVSTVVIFGTLSMFLYPIMYRYGLLSHLNDQQVAIYTGSTLHEVAHVAGAGAAMNSTDIAGSATIVKMIRVIMLAPFLIILSFFIRNKNTNEGKSKITIPWFAIWFLIVIGINTLLGEGAVKLGYEEIYKSITHVINEVDTFGLTIAMTALGTDASYKKFKEAGAKPFVMTFLLWIWLIGFGYLTTYIFAPAQ